MFKISNETFLHVSNNNFQRKLNGFLNENLEVQVEELFIEDVLALARAYKIHSEQNVAILATVVWACQREGVEFKKNFVSAIEDTNIPESTRIKKLKSRAKTIFKQVR